MKRRAFGRVLLLSIVTAAGISSFAAEFVWAPAFPEGSKIPVLEAPDHTERSRRLTA